MFGYIESNNKRKYSYASLHIGVVTVSILVDGAEEEEEEEEEEEAPPPCREYEPIRSSVTEIA